MNELRFGGANVVRDRGVEYSVVGYVTDLNKLLDHFRLVHNVGLADCCFDCFHRYDTKERTLASFINGALLPFFCHLYSHDDWYKVLNDDISLPTIFLLTHIGQSIVVPYLRENQAAFAPQTNRPMLYRGLKVGAIDGSVVRFNTISSFSHSLSIAQKFAGEGGVILRLSSDVAVHLLPIFEYAVYDEGEWVLGPGKVFLLTKHGEFYDLTIHPPVNPHKKVALQPFDLATVGVETLMTIEPGS